MIWCPDCGEAPSTGGYPNNPGRTSCPCASVSLGVAGEPWTWSYSNFEGMAGGVSSFIWLRKGVPYLVLHDVWQYGDTFDLLSSEYAESLVSDWANSARVARVIDS